MRWLLFVALCVVLVGGVCMAQEDGGLPAGEVEEEAVHVPTLVASPDMEVDVVFPDSADKNFEIGSIVKVLVSCNNIGKSAFNVSAARCSLLHPEDYSITVQNFTVTEYGSTLEPDIQGTFRYFFAPHPNIEPHDFGLICHLFYNDVVENQFVSIVFNGTINLVEPASSIDIQTLFTYMSIIMVVALVGIFVVKMSKSLKRRIFGKGHTEIGTRSGQGVENEWLEGIVQSGGARRRGGKGKKK